MLQIREDGSFAETNDLRIQEEPPDIKIVKQDKNIGTEIKEITDKYSDVFKGIGKIRDIKNGKEFYAKFSMRSEAAPVAQRPRPVAYYLQEPLKKWLEQCVEEEIFEEVRLCLTEETTEFRLQHFSFESTSDLDADWMMHEGDCTRHMWLSNSHTWTFHS
ncbi:hypothetical protein ACROYT_G040383 [Oculina patagonica]